MAGLPTTTVSASPGSRIRSAWSADTVTLCAAAAAHADKAAKGAIKARAIMAFPVELNRKTSMGRGAEETLNAHAAGRAARRSDSFHVYYKAD